jgi:hypothetical protein
MKAFEFVLSNFSYMKKRYLYCSVVLSLFCFKVIVAYPQNDINEIVLFDIRTSTMKDVSSLSGSKIEKNNNVLKVDALKNEELSGVLVEGDWNLSGCNKLIFELVNFNNEVDLPITIRIENPNADLGKGKGIQINNVSVPSGQTKEFSVSIPPQLPYPEIKEKLFGMRNTPYSLPGIASDINPLKIIRLYVYINKPTKKGQWGIKRIVAKVGAPQELPAWMQLSPEKFFPFIDAYGQFKFKDWPGKTKLESDFRESLKRELSDIEIHSGAIDRDQFGGWKNGPKQEATGQFYVTKVEDKWWMVDPEGNLFWSHGPVRVTSSYAITPLDDRKFYFTGLPDQDSPFAQFYKTRDELLYPYYVARGVKETYDFSSANIYRKYGENWQSEYADMVHKRLKSWGMNTIANGSDVKICLLDKTPYTDRIEIKSPAIEGSSGQWWKFKDPFHPEFCPNIRGQLLKHKAELDDPWCFGFFVDNEINWGSESSLAEWTLQSLPSQPVKIAFINWLKDQYKEVEKLNDAWKTDYSNWDAILISQEKPLPEAKNDCIKYSSIIAEEYFKNVRGEFKKIAPNKLYLGCRFAGSHESLIRIASKYCDVISFNIYKKTLSDFKLPVGIDKPVIVGEFHFGALDRGLFHTGLVPVKDQEERGQTFADYIESGLKHPNIIGAHWFQYGDEATTGRFDGENFQIGLVDVCDNPYPETIAKIRIIGYKMYEIRNGK